jgi:RNA-directed DNA polymerase
MSYGQTNGIPQGSVLMDFIAEILLKAIDNEIQNKTETMKIKIIRYRDDYRIFSASEYDGTSVLKIISDILFDWGLRLNSSKTFTSSNIIRDSVKPDKIFNLTIHKEKNLQKRLMQILHISEKFPNCGTLPKELNDFCRKIERLVKSESNFNKKNNAQVLISLILELSIKNPKIIPVCSAILSILIKTFEGKKEQEDFINKVNKKFGEYQNTSFNQLWLQRISFKIDDKTKYNEKLCQVVANKEFNLCNLWCLGCPKILKPLISRIEKISIIDRDYLEKMDIKIPLNEVDLFNKNYPE